jgi:hypothetical protein
LKINLLRFGIGIFDGKLKSDVRVQITGLPSWDYPEQPVTMHDLFMPKELLNECMIRGILCP